MKKIKKAAITVKIKKTNNLAANLPLLSVFFESFKFFIKYKTDINSGNVSTILKKISITVFAIIIPYLQGASHLKR